MSLSNLSCTHLHLSVVHEFTLGFSWVSVAKYIVAFSISLSVLLLVFWWPLYLLYLFCLRFILPPLVSSNYSQFDVTLYNSFHFRPFQPTLKLCETDAQGIDVVTFISKYILLKECLNASIIPQFLKVICKRKLPMVIQFCFFSLISHVWYLAKILFYLSGGFFLLKL